MALLNYHHHAMEARRSLELKVFTGGVAFLLVITKGLHDSPAYISSRWAPTATAVIFGLLWAIYLFMLFRIEIATSPDRRSYHFLEQKIGEILAINANGKVVGKRDRRETWCEVLLRSWAAVPPFCAATVIAIACWLYLFLSPKTEPCV
jgi:hypothetical protein